MTLTKTWNVEPLNFDSERGEEDENGRNLE